MNFSTQYILQEASNPKSIRFGNIEFTPAKAVGPNMDCIILPEKNNTVKFIRTTFMILQLNGFGDMLNFYDLSLKNKLIFSVQNISPNVFSIPFEYVFTSDKLSIRLSGSLNANFSIAYQRVYES